MWNPQGLLRHLRLCPGSEWKRPQILVPVLFLPVFLFCFIVCWGEAQQDVLILRVQRNELSVCTYNVTAPRWLKNGSHLPGACPPGSSWSQGKLYLDFYHCGKGFTYSQTSYKWKLNMDSVSGFFCWTLHLGDSTKLWKAAAVCSSPLNCSILSLEYHHSLDRQLSCIQLLRTF